MTKKELTNKITFKTNITAKKAGNLINIIFDIISEELENDGHYTQRNFGTFKVIERAPRKAINPQTGEMINVPKKNSIQFITSRNLKERINGGM